MTTIAAPAPAPTEVLAALTETPAAPAPAPEPEPPISPRIAAIAKEEKRIEAERTAIKTRAAELEAKEKAVAEQASRLEKAKASLLADPIGYFSALGVTEQKELGLLGEALMYTLVPDRAPQDLRARMNEAQAKREQETAKQKAEREAQEAAAAQAERTVRTFAEKLVTAVTPDATPAVVAWFDGDNDALTESLMFTARNLAQAAEEAGTVADLSPANVAAVLEQEIDKRYSRRPQKPNAPAQDRAAPPAEEPKQSVMSVKDTSAGRPPTPKAISDAERIKRAAEAFFGPAT